MTDRGDERPGSTQRGAVFERAARVVFVTAVFLVPIVFEPRTLDAFNIVKLTALWCLGLLALGAWSFSTHGSARSRFLPRSRLIPMSLVLLAITALATLLSPNRTLSFFGLYHRYEGLLSIAIYVGTVVVIGLLYGRRPDALRSVAAAIGGAAGIGAGYVVLQRFGIDLAQWRQGGGTAPSVPIGSLGNAALSAAYIGISAPFVVYLGLSARSVARKFAWAVVGLVMILGLWFTQGRTGMLAATAGILTLALLTSGVKPLQKVAFVVVTLLALALTPVLFGDPTDSAQSGVPGAAATGYRVQVWDASFRMFLERPILGWGPETFYGNYPRFRRADEARRQGLVIADRPHSIYLGWATATGIVGLVAWLLLVGGAVASVAGRAAKLIRARRMLAAAFGAGLVAYLAQGVFSIDVPPLAFMGWIAVGAIAVLLEGDGRGEAADGQSEASLLESQESARSSMGSDRRPVERERFRRAPVWLRRGWLAPTISGILLLLLVFFGFGPLRADHAAWAAERRARQGWSTRTMELYEKAIALNPYEAAYRGLAASYLERIAGNTAAARGLPFSPRAALGRAASYYRQALRLQPTNVYFMISIARVYAQLGHQVDEKYFATADRYLARAANLDPVDPQMHDLYAALLNEWQQELRGRKRREIRSRAQAQAGIAQALRAGRVVR